MHEPQPITSQPKLIDNGANLLQAQLVQNGQDMEKAEEERKKQQRQEDCCFYIEPEDGFDCFILCRCVFWICRSIGECTEKCCDSCAEGINDCCNSDGGGCFEGGDSDCSCCSCDD